MKKNDLFYWLSLIFLALLLSAWFGYRYKNCHEDFQELSNSYYNEALSIEAVYDEIAFLRSLELENDVVRIPDISLRNRRGIACKLNNIVEDGVWVFRFHENSCSPCIEENLRLINSTIPENFIILASFTNFGSFRAFAKSQTVKNLYFIDTDYNTTLIPSDKYFLPTYFGLSSSLKVQNSTIPPKGSLKISEQFLDFIER